MGVQVSDTSKTKLLTVQNLDFSFYVDSVTVLKA